MTTQEHDEFQGDIRKVMGFSEGRRFVRWLLKLTHYGGTVLDWSEIPTVPPEFAVWVTAGQREVGNIIHDEVAMAAPQGVQLMNREAYERRVAKENAALEKPKKNEGDE